MNAFRSPSLEPARRRAAAVYQLYAPTGDPFAMLRLAHFYLYGLGGLPKNQGEALRLLQQAAQKGEVQAGTNLGAAFENGWGCEKNDATAVIWYRWAADNGNCLGAAYLGRNYQAGTRGLQKDEVEAVRLYRQAASRVGALTVPFLSWMQSHGLNEVGMVLYRAFEAVEAESFVNLGYMYLFGLGGLPKNDSEALRLFREASDKGCPDGTLWLGRMNETGRGGLRADKEEAMRLYSQAAPDSPLAKERFTELSNRKAIQGFTEEAAGLAASFGAKWLTRKLFE